MSSCAGAISQSETVRKYFLPAVRLHDGEIPSGNLLLSSLFFIVTMVATVNTNGSDSLLNGKSDDVVLDRAAEVHGVSNHPFTLH